MAEAQDTPYDCIIVGAGYAGLAAAKYLTEHESKPRILILEARNRIGGRAKTIHRDDGSYWDVGGSFLGLKQDLMYDLAREYGVATFPIPQKGKHIFYSRGRAKKYSGLVPPMRLWEMVDSGLVLWKLDRLAASIDVEAPWAHPKAKVWDRMTADQWTRKNVKTEMGRAAMEMAWGAIFGKPSEELPLLHVLYVFKTLGGVDAALKSKDGLQEDMMVGGGTAIAEKIREAVGGDRTVKLNEPVQQVDFDGEEGGSGCTITTANNRYRSKRVIFAIPPQFAARVRFNPPLPAPKQALLEAMELGAYTKVFATYSRGFWRERGLRGECTNIDGYVSVVFDATSPKPGSDFKLMGFVTGAKSREFAKMPEDERKRLALADFANMLGKDALECKEFMYHTMLDEEWAAGCPLASPSLGIWTEHGEWLRKPVGPTHWAGTDTATHFYGYMEGAVSTGFRAAKEVVDALSAGPAN